MSNPAFPPAAVTGTNPVYARKADHRPADDAIGLNGSDQYLLKAAHSLTDDDVALVSFWVWFNATGTQEFILGIGDDHPSIKKDTSDRIDYRFYNAALGEIFKIRMNNGTAVSVNQWTHVFIAIDCSNSARYELYIDGATNANNVTNSADTNAFEAGEIVIGADSAGGGGSGNWLNGKLAEFYMITGAKGVTWTNVQASNALTKFRDTNGNPVDLKQGLAPFGVQPEIYLPFDDGSDLGKNWGTAGDFTNNGSIIKVNGPG